MKNLKLTSLISMFLIVGMSMVTSCGKITGTDVSDSDEVGKFELTIDGKKETGTKVFTGAVIGIRTVSAENEDMTIAFLFDESEFTSGNSIENSSLSTIERKDKPGGIMTSGKIKVISKSKIELIDVIFTETGESSVELVKVSGFISSK